MPKYTTFPDGSFMLVWERTPCVPRDPGRIPPGVRAWYTRDGVLKDSAYKRSYRGRPIEAAVSQKHTKVLTWLAKQGETFRSHGDLK